jgi:hypothetical protein
VGADQLAQLRDHVALPSESEFGLCVVLDRAQSHLVESRGGRVGHVRQRRPPPQRERLTEQLRRVVGLASRQRVTVPGGEPFEPVRVDV